MVPADPITITPEDIAQAIQDNFSQTLQENPMLSLRSLNQALRRIIKEQTITIQELEDKLTTTNGN